MNLRIRRLVKYLAKALLGLVVLAALLAAVVKFWIIPAVVRHTIRQNVARYWDGTVEIEQVDFSFSGPSFLKGISVYDRAGRRWACIGSVRLGLDNWPGLAPTLTEAHLKQLDLRAHFVNGRCRPPLRSPARLDKHSALKRISAAEISLTIVDEAGAEATWGNLEFHLANADNEGEFTLTLPAGDGSKTTLLAGMLADGSFRNTVLRANLAIDRAKARTILSALKAPLARTAEGNITADVKISGAFRQPSIQGYVKFNNWTVLATDGVLLEDLGTTVMLKGRRAELSGFSASLCDGYLEADAELAFPPGGPLDYRGQISTGGVDLRQLASVAGQQNTRGGRLTASYTFGGKVHRQKRTWTCHGDGAVFVDDADLWSLSATAKLFGALGLGRRDPSRISDAEAVFTTNGYTVTIQDGRLANAISAIRAEPGGIIDLKTGRLDIYVVAVPLELVSKLLSSMPVVRLFTNIADKLTHMRVHGRWNDPQSIVVTRQPVRDVEEATILFFSDMVKSGGQLKGLLKPLGGLLYKPKRKR
ncbi:MAG: hypothetical protein SVT52_00205 [Planctomycetota bacterium]|nr:hypothetical protein [Planctomycetota bacterium]